MNENTGSGPGRSRPWRLRPVPLAGFPSSGVDVNSPQFQSAAKTCGEPGPPSGG
jgi:hypothetical protein